MGDFVAQMTLCHPQINYKEGGGRGEGERKRRRRKISIDKNLVVVICNIWSYLHTDLSKEKKQDREAWTATRFSMTVRN